MFKIDRGALGRIELGMYDEFGLILTLDAYGPDGAAGYSDEIETDDPTKTLMGETGVIERAKRGELDWVFTPGACGDAF